MIIGTQKVQYHYTKFLASSVHGSLAMNYSDLRRFVCVIIDHRGKINHSQSHPSESTRTFILHDQNH